MLKKLRAKYYPENNEGLQTRAREIYQNLCKEKNDNRVVNDTKISQRKKNKSLLSIDKNILE